MNFKTLLFSALLILVCACSTPEKKRITILYTVDEHGWMNANENADGAAGMMALWKEKENYTLESDSFLVLSGGDMWTGSSVSTLFKGQSMYQVMQAMGYDAVALGNHEFDFSIDTLIARSDRSSFPYLAANIENEKGEVPCFVQPWHLIEVNGLSVGILGLANLETPQTSSATAVKGLSFSPYEEAIAKYVPEMKENGAEVVLIVGHICKAEMESLTSLAVEYDIPLITGGHCHEPVLEMKDSVLLIETAPFLISYIKVLLEYDKRTKDSRIISYEAVANKSEDRDSEINSLVTKWQDKADETLNVGIGFTKKGIIKKSELMGQLITTSWLMQVASCDIAITNAGGIRQDINAGEITYGTVLGLLPFNNEILRLKVSGKEMNDFVRRLPQLREDYVWGGMTPNDKYDDTKEYTLLTTDFLYALAETHFQSYDEVPYHTGLNYRDPIMVYVESLKTSEKKPLESFFK